jgi:hypothetical protein
MTSGTGTSSTVLGYLRQSPFTSPGSYASQFDPLPDDVRGLCKVVQGLLVHYRDENLALRHVPKRRYREVNLRYVDRMLARILELDPRPLSQPRPLNRRLIGCCRDFAVLFTSMARHKGIPTRVRVGFANYFSYAPGFWIDHTIAERWEGNRRGWRLVDPEQSTVLARENRLDFDPAEVPWGRFIVGGQAWKMCRTGEADPSRFCVAPGSEPRGLWFVRSRLMLDLGALNREELLLWDSWKATAPDARMTRPRLAALDQVASVTGRSPPSVSAASKMYQSGGLRHTPSVGCYSPVCPPYVEKLRS